jgi:putative oxidoreductase
MTLASSPNNLQNCKRYLGKTNVQGVIANEMVALRNLPHWRSIMLKDPQPYGVALLRVSLGVMFVAHGLVLKVMTFGLDGTAQFFQSIGYPGWLAYLTVFAEILGGAALILGVQTRWVALALSPILLGALAVHVPNGWVFNAVNGGWEYPAYLFVLAIAQALLGDGAFALWKSWRLGSVAIRSPSNAKAQF